MKNNTAFTELCYSWACAFGVEDAVEEAIKVKHKGTAKVLKELGLELTNEILADIFDLTFDGDNFIINEYSVAYFNNRDLGDIATYVDMQLIDETYNLIKDYVSENY